MKKIMLAGALLGMILLILSACQPPTGTIVDATTGDGCSSLGGSAKDDCYFEARACSKIQTLSIRDSCVAELAKIKEDINVCNLILDSKTKGYCQQQIAELTNNHDICSAIESGYWRDNCNYHLALSNNKDTYCILIADSSQREECFDKVAVATNNKLICEFLTGDKRGQCLFTVAVNSHDTMLCQELDSVINRDVCRKRISKETKDKDTCELIGTRAIEEDCLKQFEVS